MRGRGRERENEREREREREREIDPRQLIRIIVRVSESSTNELISFN